ncbi:MAG: UDP-glucose--hexose-1-phosphate uridylyltransferase [Clostridiales bacterium]|nr:UDP-glucose--hexose-1-phosphate uridylyltransferase [Clostridiales bacterium]
MNREINALLQYAVQMGLLPLEEYDYAANLLLDLLGEDSFAYEPVQPLPETADPILQTLLDKAVSKGLIENDGTSRDLFDTRIMNCVMPRPHTVIQSFWQAYADTPQSATDYYYRLSIASNYIRKSRTDKNIVWNSPTPYGDMEISINLSKPEKDPKEIARARAIQPSGYPKCLLCKENVGFSGDAARAARQTHRIIPLALATGKYYLQYSPYVYYNEHCIVLNQTHQPMVVDKSTFQNLFSFLDLFPHYMIGSNADLPIVGGSILSHDHYQGGRHIFPIQKAKVLYAFPLGQEDTLVELVKWPLSTIRLTSASKEALIHLSCRILDCWRSYDAPAYGIFCHTGTTPHNTITPIARRVGQKYQIDLVLRNNRTDETYPDGIFHPHPSLHHIKKENIGLIEVMGLAILPARLKEELSQLANCLLGRADIDAYPQLEKHCAWYQELLSQPAFTTQNIQERIKQSVAEKYVQVLEDAGVFKMDDNGLCGLMCFVKRALKGE